MNRYVAQELPQCCRSRLFVNRLASTPPAIKSTQATGYMANMMAITQRGMTFPFLFAPSRHLGAWELEV